MLAIIGEFQTGPIGQALWVVICICYIACCKWSLKSTLLRSSCYILHKGIKLTDSYARKSYILIVLESTPNAKMRPSGSKAVVGRPLACTTPYEYSQNLVCFSNRIKLANLPDMSVILNPITVQFCQVMMKEIDRLWVTFPVTQPYSKT